MTALTDAIAQSLIDSPALANRTPQSTPMVLTVGRVENRSADVFTRAEQWYLMQSVARRIVDPATTGPARNIVFVMPPEAVRDIRRRGQLWSGFAQDRAPTHEITGRFSSISRAGADERSDLFEFAYQIVDLSTGAILADEAVDITTAARGRLFN